MDFRKLIDVDVRGKRVLVRVDFNVPLAGGEVRDDTRIRYVLPTIQYLLKEGAAIILLSHLGRPRGNVVEELRLDPVAQRLSDLLGREVIKTDEVRGETVRKEAERLQPGQILLLENTRFDPGETQNDPELAREWAQLGHVFINDAFGTAHRAHASNVGLSQKLPAAAGFLLDRELEALGKLVKGDVDRPYAAILGGAKISDKIGVIKALIKQADFLLLGGGMANTFLAARGWEMGSSLVEAEGLATALSIMEKADKAGKKVILPQDLIISTSTDGKGEIRCLVEPEVPKGWLAVDIGPRTRAVYKNTLSKARTVFWNGPLGIFEVPAFAEGTMEIARFIAGLDAFTVVGGGDSAASVEAAGVTASIRHISTGGGAALALLEKGDLPAISVLQKG